ncbi:MAG: 7-carboxy-7-deazaguanine synthase QueE [Candidatus Brocadiia bacterium]
MNPTRASDSDCAGNLFAVFASIQGEGPHVGESHLFVRLAGCNAGCTYCDTPEALSIPKTATVYTRDGLIHVPNPCTARRLAEIIDGFLNSSAFAAIAITGGEPLQQPGFIRALTGMLPTVRPRVLLETNGLLPEALSQVIDIVDIVSADWKLASTGVPSANEARSTQFVGIASARCETIVKIPFSASTSTEEVLSAVRMITSVAPSAIIVLQPITEPHGVCRIPPVAILALHQACLRVNGGVRVIPQVHKMLMIR